MCWINIRKKITKQLGCFHLSYSLFASFRWEINNNLYRLHTYPSAFLFFKACIENWMCFFMFECSCTIHYPVVANYTFLPYPYVFLLFYFHLALCAFYGFTNSDHNRKTFLNKEVVDVIVEFGRWLTGWKRSMNYAEVNWIGSTWIKQNQYQLNWFKINSKLVEPDQNFMIRFKIKKKLQIASNSTQKINFLIN